MVAVIHTVDAYVVNGHTCDSGVQWRQFVANHVGVDYVGFVHLQRRDDTENVRTVGEMKMEEKQPRGRSRLRSKDTVRYMEA